MSDINVKLKTKNHAVFTLVYHIVLVIKYRHPVINSGILERLREIFTELCQKWEGKLIEFSGEADHVHLAVELNPTITPSEFVKNIKSVSSRYIRREFSEHLKPYFWKPYFWHSAYGLFSVSVDKSLAAIVDYIANQDKPKR